METFKRQNVLQTDMQAVSDVNKCADSVWTLKMMQNDGRCLNGSHILIGWILDNNPVKQKR